MRPKLYHWRKACTMVQSPNRFRDFHHNDCKNERTWCWSLMFSHFNWERLCHTHRCMYVSRYFVIHVLYYLNVPSLNTSILEAIPNYVLWYAIVRFLKVNEHQMQILLSLLILFHQSPQMMNCFGGWSSQHAVSCNYFLNPNCFGGWS